MPQAPSTPASPLATAGRRATESTLAQLGEVRRSWRIILQATVAAFLAYTVALAIGHEQPFFAPIAAVATVAISLAHRLRRSAELLVGNAVGILLADVLIGIVGTGPWQLALVVAIALISAILMGGGPILIMQASSAAILIATLTPPTDAEPWNTARFVDALVGGGIGLLVSALLLPVDPARHARQATDPVISSIATGYREVGGALAAGDVEAAFEVLNGLRRTAPVLEGFHAGLDATRESIRLAPWYWGQRTLLATYALAGFHLDNALRNLRVLARQAWVALDRGDHTGPGIPRALEDLAVATEALRGVLAGEDPGLMRDSALSAVAQVSGVPAGGLFAAPIMAQIRLSASDLLQASGMSSAEAAAAIRAVAGTTPAAG